MEPSQAQPEPRAVESAIAPVEEVGAVLGYAARPAGAKRVWRWIRPGSVLFFVMVAGLAVGVVKVGRHKYLLPWRKLAIRRVS